MSGTGSGTRLLELIFFVYFVLHIPITIFADSQAIFPESWYPEMIRSVKEQYTVIFKDAVFGDPSIWLQSFIVCEMIFQLPFFFFAAYAFYHGNCPWIRIPAIVYSSHVSTTVIPIVSEIYLSDFSSYSMPGPSTIQERTALVGVYAPFLVVPIILLFAMLFNSKYANGNIKIKGN